MSHTNRTVRPAAEGYHERPFVSPALIRTELEQLFPDGDDRWLRGLSQVASLILTLDQIVGESNHSSRLREDPKVDLCLTRVMRVANVWRARVGTQLIQIIRISMNITQHLAYNCPDLATEISDSTAQLIFAAVMETALFGTRW